MHDLVVLWCFSRHSQNVSEPAMELIRRTCPEATSPHREVSSNSDSRSGGTCDMPVAPEGVLTWSGVIVEPGESGSFFVKVLVLVFCWLVARCCHMLSIMWQQCAVGHVVCLPYPLSQLETVVCNETTPRSTAKTVAGCCSTW